MGQLTRLDSCCQAWACQHEVKGFWTVTPHYRLGPSGRAEDQEAGAVGAAGAWSVRPAAPAAAPGKMYIAIIAYDIVCIHRMHISPVSGDMRLRHRIIRTTSYNTDVTHAYRIRHRGKPTISYTTSYVTSYVRLAKTVKNLRSRRSKPMIS